MDQVDARLLLELRAAVAAGLSPAEALVAATRGGALEPVVRDLRVGRSLADVATSLRPDTEAWAVLLVRALAVAEATGAGALAAVDQAMESVRSEADLQRLLDIRTTDARGTAALLSCLPVAVWAVLAVLDPSSLGVYRTGPGIVAAILAIVLIALAWHVMRRLVQSTVDTAMAADPLSTAEPSPWRASLAAAVATGMAVAVITAPAAGVTAAVLVLAGIRRRGRRQRGHHPGGAAETIELVGCALTAALPVIPALTCVARLAPHAAREVLAGAARRASSGWTLEAAFADTPLTMLGETLAAAQRWGAPADVSLRRLTKDLRAVRRAAAEQAAERLQLALVFPTTLLTLPAFVLGIVPPLLWSTLT